MKKNKYNWNADDYAKHSSAQLNWARELIQKLALNGSESVLDVGCGDGKITAELARMLPHGLVQGIDNSKEMIQLAKESFPSQKFSNLDFAIMDALNIQYNDQFDLVFSNAALHWIQGHQPVLTGISNALKPGGRYLLQMGGSGNAAEILTVVNQIISNPEWLPYFQEFTFPYGFYTPEDYEKWIINTRLKPVRTELLPKDMVYDSDEKLKGWFRTTWLPYIEKVPMDLKEQFIDEIINTFLLNNPPDASGNIRIKMVRLETQGFKV